MPPAWILVIAQAKVYIWSYTNDHISDPMYSSLDCGRSSLDCGLSGFLDSTMGLVSLRLYCTIPWKLRHTVRFWHGFRHVPERSTIKKRSAVQEAIKQDADKLLNVLLPLKWPTWRWLAPTIECSCSACCRVVDVYERLLESSTICTICNSDLALLYCSEILPKKYYRFYYSTADLAFVFLRRISELYYSVDVL